MSALGWPRWIAHRAGGDAAPENTLGGVALAARSGFEAIEVDVRLAADGLPVVLHDLTLHRTTGQAGRVDHYSSIELSRMRASVGFEGSEHALETIPELSMLLTVAAYHQVKVNLELKGGNESPGALVAAVASQLEALAWALPPQALLISAFDPELLVAARTALPLVPRALLCEQAGHETVECARALDCRALNPACAHCSRELVEHAREAGLSVCAWTVNDHDQARALFALGVTAVFTDRMAFARLAA
ncbi:MAG: glycerophosphodiester phosphodiesterase [Pseudomonadota bacterium]|nr:glycerophosphodiester phosphodiesterase [Pseudomonadota bacterium]